MVTIADEKPIIVAFILFQFVTELTVQLHTFYVDEDKNSCRLPPFLFGWRLSQKCCFPQSRKAHKEILIDHNSFVFFASLWDT